MRGARARFPVKLIYASVLPMILVRVLQANIQMIGMFLYNIGITIFGTFDGVTAVSGLMYYLSPSMVRNSGCGGRLMCVILPGRSSSVSVSIPPSWSWAVRSSHSSGSRRPVSIQRMWHARSSSRGCRSRVTGGIPQVLEKYLDRYIPRVTVIGGVFIGVLSVVANLFGVIGAVSGTGLLLTVSITYRLYEEIASQQIMEMYPFMRTFFGKE